VTVIINTNSHPKTNVSSLDLQEYDSKTTRTRPVINLDGASLTVSSDSETILETIESAGIELEFHCREGFCGVCRTKLLSGDVEYTVDPLAFIEDDEILICCSKPLGDIALKAIM
jgi:ferredoxin